MATILSPFSGYNTVLFVELRGEDLVCYSNKIKSVYLRKCLYDHQLISVTVTNIYKSFTHKMAAKTSYHRCATKVAYVAVSLCISHRYAGILGTFNPEVMQM